ncbi:peptidase dimerization domain-containing protein, partial [bacterium]|nr:peptidase dimerization domain-containing protein [bacterium]
HNWPMMAPGTVGLNEGAMMAAADRVTIEISGKGGHGAHPYQTVDVVLVASDIVAALQSIVSRNVRAIDSAVLSICAMQAGDLGAFSVLPGEATLVGTVRSFSTTVQDLMEQRIKEVCSAVALGLGASATVRYERIYPATINTAAEARFAGDVAASLVGEADERDGHGIEAHESSGGGIDRDLVRAREDEVLHVRTHCARARAIARDGPIHDGEDAGVDLLLDSKQVHKRFVDD